MSEDRRDYFASVPDHVNLYLVATTPRVERRDPLTVATLRLGACGLIAGTLEKAATDLETAKVHADAQGMSRDAWRIEGLIEEARALARDVKRGAEQ